MRKFMIGSAVISLLFSFFMSCSDDGGDVTNTGGTTLDTPIPAPQRLPVIIGSWQEIFPAFPPYIPESLSIDFDVIADTSYVLELNSMTGKTIFRHAGTWTADQDSIYLAGKNCAALDTTAEPDTLKPMPDSMCSMPISIYLNISTRQTDTLWTVKGGDLGPLIRSFPIPPNAASLLQSFSFELEKQ